MKDIKNFEGLYAISEDGRVWSHPKKWSAGFNLKKSNSGHGGKWLSPSYKKCRYPKVCLVKNKIRFSKDIHRLVAETFIPNPKNLPEVNHIDFNRLNNCVTNLEWCTAEENNLHYAKSVGRA